MTKLLNVCKLTVCFILILGCIFTTGCSQEQKSINSDDTEVSFCNYKGCAVSNKFYFQDFNKDNGNQINVFDENKMVIWEYK